MGFFIRLSVVLGLFFFAGFGAQGAAPGDSAGVVLESTRVIYPESEKKGITFTVTNRTGQTYLLQSRVVPWGSAQTPSETSGAAPFIVVPPLTRFAPDDALTLRIRLTKNNLPTDRESVFWLSLKAIPSQPAPGNSSEEGAKMVLALQNNIKLFYRPAKLVTLEPEARAEALQFTRQGTQLLVHNPTPYYVTLGEIKTGTEAITLGEQRMLAPFSTTAFNSPVTQSTSLSWHIIDDNGRHTTRQSRSLN